jgi:hypothetical protein
MGVVEEVALARTRGSAKGQPRENERLVTDLVVRPSSLPTTLARVTRATPWPVKPSMRSGHFDADDIWAGWLLDPEKPMLH